MKKMFILLSFFCATIYPMNHTEMFLLTDDNNPYKTLSHNVNVLCTRCKQTSSCIFKYDDDHYHDDEDLIAMICPHCKYDNNIMEKNIKWYICSPNTPLNATLSESKKTVLHKTRKFEKTIEESLERIISKKTELKKIKKETNKLPKKHKKSKIEIGSEILAFCYKKSYESKRIPHIKKALSNLTKKIDHIIDKTPEKIKYLPKPRKPRYPQKRFLPQKNKGYSKYHTAIKRAGGMATFSLTGLATYHLSKKIIGIKKKLVFFVVSLGASIFASGISYLTIFNPYSKKCKKYKKSFKEYEDNLSSDCRQYNNSFQKFLTSDTYMYEKKINEIKVKEGVALYLKKVIEYNEKMNLQDSFRENIMPNKKYNDAIIICE